MTGWDSEVVQSLLMLARDPPDAKNSSDRDSSDVNCVCVEGMMLNPQTGIVLRCDLSLDAGPYGYCAPIYTYDRTNRFSCLLMPSGVPMCSRHLVIRVFEQLEKLWEDTKTKYERKYFLSQKLVLREVCRRLGVKCNLPVAIRDTKRRRSQMRIFEDMWRNLLSSKLR